MHLLLILQSAGQAAGKERWLCSVENNDPHKKKSEPTVMNLCSCVSLAIYKHPTYRRSWHASPWSCTPPSLRSEICTCWRRWGQELGLLWAQVLPFPNMASYVQELQLSLILHRPSECKHRCCFASFPPSKFWANFSTANQTQNWEGRGILGNVSQLS